jgi:hypothetical protein
MTFASLAQMDSVLQDERNKTVGFRRKFRWAVVDRGRFEVMIGDLRDYNDGLYSLLSSVERRRLRQALAPEVVPSQEGGTAVGELRELGQAGNEYAELTPVAVLAAERLRIEDGGSSSMPGEDVKIDGRRIVLDMPFGEGGGPQLTDRTMATLSDAQDSGSGGGGDGGRRRTVLVEWKFYDKDLGESIKQEQLRRLDALARLLHANPRSPLLQVPHCLGYVADDWQPRVGFVFEYAAATSPPWSLWDTLGGKAIPYVGDRFRLAHKLSLSLCILHTAGWLHKGIRSQNVIFSSPLPAPSVSSSAAAGPAPPRLDEPQLLGFEYSRPDTPAAISDTIRNATELMDLHRHPRSLVVGGRPRSRFERAFDIYALGIVLLELGFWRRIDEFWHASYSGQPERFALDLRTFHVPKLGAKMGRIYMEVVLGCLNGDAAAESGRGGSTGEDNPQQSFYWAVVDRLSKLVA